MTRKLENTKSRWRNSGAHGTAGNIFCLIE